MELLSPAGNYECLVAAVRAGADAVYIGGTGFSARRNAKNFTNEEIIAACRLCHLHNVKLYVALNILIKEKEFANAVRYAASLCEAGVDGIIVQDLGLLAHIRKMCPDIFINASTQMTVASTEAVNFAKNLGANRVVLARELGLSQIKLIAENTDIELETFVHGALCMGWSGQCLLSSVIGGRSGNRGLCAQPCRLNYTLLKDGKAVSRNMPLLSLKDICLADRLEEIAPYVHSLKIEGRMKSPEYTAAVTSLYKKAKTGEVSAEEIDKTLAFFSRGGSSWGYFEGRKFDKMMDYDSAGKVGTTRADVVKIKEEDLSSRRGISFILEAKEGSPLHLTATSDSFFAQAQGDILEPARKDFDPERLRAQLEKLGDTAFCAESIEISHEGNPFVPVSAINALRRQVCATLEELICNSYKKEVFATSLFEKTSRKRTAPRIIIEVSTEEQLTASKEFDYEIITSYELSKKVDSDFVLCPAVKKEGENDRISASKIMAQNIGQLDFTKEVYGGERLNVTNSATCELLSAKGVKRVTLSPELNINEIKEITKNTAVPTEVIAYGRVPVMVMENCVIKSQGLCSKGGGAYELADRLGERFPIVCENCRNIMLNSVPVYMADKWADLLSLNVDAIRLKFTTESAQEVKQVINAYKDAMAGITPKGVFDKITRGHFYRGVE